MWELFFPAIVANTSLAYYREYLAREALRHVKHDPSPSAATDNDTLDTPATYRYAR